MLRPFARIVALLARLVLFLLIASVVIAAVGILLLRLGTISESSLPSFLTKAPVVRTLLNTLVPESAQSGSTTGVQGTQAVRISDLQRAQLEDPIAGDPCFFRNVNTCFYGATVENATTQASPTGATTSSALVPSTAGSAAQTTISASAMTSTQPDYRYSLSLFWGYPGALLQHYSFGLANGGVDADPILTSVRTVVDRGIEGDISPLFLLAYYDFMIGQAKAFDVTPQDIGLPASDVFPLTPEPAKLISLFRVAEVIFGLDQTNFGEIAAGVQDDELSTWLKTQPMSAQGKVLVYVTSQMFGTKLASQIFTQPGKFSRHYENIFRDPSLAGNFAIQTDSSQGQLPPFTYFSRSEGQLNQAEQRELVVCQNQQAYSCGFGDLKVQADGTKLLSCSPLRVFDGLCLENLLVGAQ